MLVLFNDKYQQDVERMWGVDDEENVVGGMASLMAR